MKIPKDKNPMQNNEMSLTNLSEAVGHLKLAFESNMTLGEKNIVLHCRKFPFFLFYVTLGYVVFLLWLERRAICYSFCTVLRYKSTAKLFAIFFLLEMVQFFVISLIANFIFNFQYNLCCGLIVIQCHNKPKIAFSYMIIRFKCPIFGLF